MMDTCSAIFDYSFANISLIFQIDANIGKNINKLNLIFLKVINLIMNKIRIQVSDFASGRTTPGLYLLLFSLDIINEYVSM